MKQIRVKTSCNLGRYYYAPGDIASVSEYLANWAIEKGLADLYTGNTVAADGAHRTEQADAERREMLNNHPMSKRLRGETPVAEQRAEMVAEAEASPVPVKKAKAARR